MPPQAHIQYEHKAWVGALIHFHQLEKQYALVLFIYEWE